MGLPPVTAVVIPHSYTAHLFKKRETKSGKGRYDQTAIGFLPVTSDVFLIAKQFW
jgi:hypothetical protein